MFVVFALGVSAGIVSWLLALYQCVSRFPGSRDHRLTWILVLVFCAFIGASVYWFFGPHNETVSVTD